MTGTVQRYLILVAILSLAVTGCLRSANTDNGVAVQEQVLNTPTQPPTPIPTQEPVVVTQEVVVTATPEPAQEVFPNQIEPEATFETSELEAQDVPAQDQVQVEPRFQTATAIIEQATLAVVYVTQTAEAALNPISTNTPTLDPFAATPTPGQILSGADCVHEVVFGENLFRLSMRYGVSIQDIALASGITNPNLLAVGQKLVIPGCGTTGVFPPPTSIPSGSADGSGGFGTGSGTTGTGGTGSAGGVIHVVQQYESLFQISLQYNVPINTIAAANGISNVSLIYIGQELVIP